MRQLKTEEISWHLVTQKQYPVFGRYWMTESFRDEMQKSLGMGLQNFKSLYSGIYADKAEFNRVNHLLAQRMDDNPEAILRITKDWQTASKDLLAFSQKIPRDLTAYSNSQLLSLIDQAITNFKRSSSYIYLRFASATYSERWLEGLLTRNNIPPENHKEYFQILATSTKPTGLLSAMEDLSVMKKITNPDELERAIADYAKKYAWIGYDTGFGHNLSRDEVRDKLRHLQSDSVIQDVASRAEVLQKLKLIGQDKMRFRLMRNIMHSSEFRAEAQMRAGVHFRRLLEELAARFKTDYDTLTQFTLPEIKDYLRKNKAIDTELASRRKDKFGVVMLGGKISVFSGDEVDALDETVDLPKNLDQVSGMIACQGKVTGTARIVITRKDFDKVQPGDILISKMTTPEFMVVINRCAGMITDIGGITCHAAIVSRELKKPCLIGTKYATTFFQDGDQVELDALHGTARKIVT